ncbi:MAG: hypothetical protein A3H97_15905 [Acidobacteria bacterium RIFCSPLOWO2_02_FULL_65_29]|nr:MAG: hypothetical protein A3H97_15905 [Acidobacteria bacterium RIFCSPLOWO2_02_FULL_65_29]
MRLILLSVTSFATSVVAGMLGLGGAVLLIPAYLYLPRLFGIPPLDVKSVSGMTSVQVLASALVGMWSHKRQGCVDSRLALRMGIPSAAASFGGAMVSKVVHPDAIVGTFASMAILGAVLMVTKREAAEGVGPPAYSVGAAVSIAIGVGFFGGMVGAPGAFLLSPLIMIVLKIPTRVAIGTTLGIVFFSALAASAGKIFTGQVPLLETTIAVAAALPGVYLGSRFSYLCSPHALRWAIAAVILGVGAQMWYQILF